MLIKTTTDINSPVHEDSVAIRTAVFVQEQNVPADLEVDADEGRCTYLVGYDDAGTAVATLRLNPEPYGFHVQRVAVMQSARGTGLGQAIMREAIDIAKERGAHKLVLGAQVHATGFYARLGFTFTDKPEFTEAGIQHREMAITLA